MMQSGAVQPVHIDQGQHQAQVGFYQHRFRQLFTKPLGAISFFILLLLLLLAIFGPGLYGRDPNAPDYAVINGYPSSEYLLGTDNLGRDTLARIMMGLRVSLIVAFYVETLNILLGVTLGLLAGYFGGLVDFVISRLADLLFAFPGLLLAILVAAAFGKPVTDQFGGIGRLLLVAGSLSLVSWPLMMRLIRSQVLVLREQEYVLAGKSLGATRFEIIRSHILPNIFGLILVTSTLDVATVVVNEAVLSLLGLGIQPPDPSIGKMITDATPFLEVNALQVFIPSLALMLIVLSVSFLADILRDAFA
jgi:oligopeptide transport system permease protein